LAGKSKDVLIGTPFAELLPDDGSLQILLRHVDAIQKHR
jgi:hypothetical protein